jgi:hypothetical protein
MLPNQVIYFRKVWMIWNQDTFQYNHYFNKLEKKIHEYIIDA